MRIDPNRDADEDGSLAGEQSRIAVWKRDETEAVYGDDQQIAHGRNAARRVEQDVKHAETQTGAKRLVVYGRVDAYRQRYYPHSNITDCQEEDEVIGNLPAQLSA